MLKYIDAYYGHPKIYITECGTSVPNESSLPLQQALNDTFRISYFQARLPLLPALLLHLCQLVSELRARWRAEAAAPALSTLGGTWQGYVQAAIQAAQEGVQVQSFFAWSLLDNFEWQVPPVLPVGPTRCS